MSKQTASCPFCDMNTARVFYEDDLVLALWDLYPVADGHALIVPRRHVIHWFEASDEELAALTRATRIVRERIEQRHQPDGYNIGVNVGAAAGQTVFHLHLHVIPRYEKDVKDPMGGVRGVIPSRRRYG